MFVIVIVFLFHFLYISLIIFDSSILGKKIKASSDKEWHIYIQQFFHDHYGNEYLIK